MWERNGGTGAGMGAQGGGHTQEDRHRRAAPQRAAQDQPVTAPQAAGHAGQAGCRQLSAPEPDLQRITAAVGCQLLPKRPAGGRHYWPGRWAARPKCSQSVQKAERAAWLVRKRPRAPATHRRRPSIAWVRSSAVLSRNAAALRPVFKGWKFSLEASQSGSAAGAAMAVCWALVTGALHACRRSQNIKAELVSEPRHLGRQ